MRRLTPTDLTFAALLALSACAHDAAPAADHPRGQAAEAEGDASVAAEVKREKITVDGFAFDVLTSGPVDGPTVILLHGFPQNASEWTQQIPALTAAGYRVIAPNQRGYSAGARPTEVAAYTTPNLVRDVLGIADAVGAARFHLVGHDWGASIAWAVAAAAPDRLLSVTPISVPHVDAFAQALADPTSCQPRASSYIALLVSPVAEQTLLANDSTLLRGLYGDLPKPLVDTYVEFFDAPTLTGGLNWYRANLAPPAPGEPAAAGRGTIGPIRVPTLYVWSDRDPALCRDPAERTKDFVSGPYQFEVLEGVGHWVPELAAERLNPLLLAHLAKYDAKP